MTYRPDSAVTWIVVHYSATPIERDFTIADIDQMHRVRGFKEVGYHYFIRKDGTIEAGRDLSEPGRFEQGAHSKGENDESIGICYEGGVSASAPNVGYDTRTHAQRVAMEGLILTLLDRFPRAIVEGHRDMPGAATQCPGFDVRTWWSEVSARRAHKPEVEAALEDGDKSTLQSSTIWAQIRQWAAAAFIGFGAWWSQQSEGTQIAIVAAVTLLIVGAVMSIEGGVKTIRERLRKIDLARLGKKALGL